jgi:hypothetical protein
MAERPPKPFDLDDKVVLVTGGAGVWAMQDRVIWGAERPSITGYGHYHERWVRRNGDWKIAALKLTRLHIDVHPPQ